MTQGYINSTFNHPHKHHQHHQHIQCSGQDFEKAGQLRDREMELKAKIQAITQGAKETGKAEEESSEAGGPMVDEQDIANIVAQWTGIPIEKVWG